MLYRLGSQARSVARNLPASFSKKAYRDVLFVTDGANWVTSWELREVGAVAERFGIRSRHCGPIPVGLPRQSMFFANRDVVLRRPRRYLQGGNRIAFPYYHGDPDSGNPFFVQCYENLKRYHPRICRIQVTNSVMHDLVLSSGIDPAKVFRIPIGINTSFFELQTPESRRKMREKYGIPQQATVAGSFQKDGVGWGEGNSPKMIKGPDLLLDVARVLRENVSDLFILLSGPARGYVKRGLERLQIPYRHLYLKDYPLVGELYQCLDLYLITSRQEGGPKGVLESMSSGVPLVTTRVGQARDLVRHGENGWMVDVEDTEGLAYWAEKALTDTAGLEQVLEKGIVTARENTYDAQVSLWKLFFQGFVEGP